MEASPLKRSKRRKIIVWSIVGGSVTISALTIFLWVFSFYSVINHDGNTLRFLSSSLSGYGLTEIVGSPKEVDIEKYDYSAIYNIVGAKANLFPQTINNGTVQYFEFHERVRFNYYDRYQIYLEWTMPQNVFDQGKNRISNISSSRETVMLSNDLFVFPAYVAVYNNYSSFYEYTLIDEKTYTIFYIEFENVGSIEQIVFSSDYAPQKLLKNSDLSAYSTKTGIFDIYY